MSVHQLYGGEVELRFVGGAKHDYYATDEVAGLDDDRVANVTDIARVIAKPGLEGWAFEEARKVLAAGLRPGLDEVAIRRLLDEAAGASKRIMREAGYIGSSMHKWIEGRIAECLGVGPSVVRPEHPAVRAGVEAFLEWEAEAKPEYLASERKVYSREHRFVGTLDVLAMLDGKRTIVDIKSSNRVYAEHHLQTAAYAIALDEEDDEAVQQRVILQLPKVADKKAKAYLCGDEETDRECFLAVRKVYKRIFNR